MKQISLLAKSLVPYLLVTALIIFRNPLPLTRAEFWAEDATEFFLTSMALDWRSIVVPVFGYQFLLSRLIAWISTFFPVLVIPNIYALGTLIFNILATAYFSRAGFAWLLPSRSARIFVCCLLAIAPGTAEVFFNLCNLHSALTLLALLMLLEEPFEFRKSKALILFLLACSAGQMIILLPLIVAISWALKRRDYLLYLFSILPVGILNFIGNHSVGTQQGLLAYSHAFKVPKIILENFLNRFFYAPFMGERLAEYWIKLPALVYWPISICCLLVVAYLLFRIKLPRKYLVSMGVAVLCVVSTYGIIAITRSYNLDVVSRHSGTLLWNHRYAYLPGALAVLIWCLIGFYVVRRFINAPEISKRLTAWVAIAALGVISFHNIFQWTQVYARANLHWPSKAAEIQAALNMRDAGKLAAPVTISAIGIHPIWFASFNFTIQPSPVLQPEVVPAVQKPVP